MPTSKDFTYTRALFDLFRNVKNYRKLREYRLQVSHVFVIYRHETHSRIILCTCSLENNAFSVLNYVKKVTLTLPYVTPLRDSFYLGTFEHGFIMLLPSTQPRVFAKLLVSIKFLETKSGFFFALYMQYSPPFQMCGRTFQCLTALY